MTNPYDVLGLSQDASVEALKRRFRARLREVHPDLNPQDPEAHVKTQTLVEAYECLSDTGRRAALDERLRKAAPRGEAKSSHKKAKSKGQRKAKAKPKKTKAQRAKKKPRSNFRQENVVIINGQRIDFEGQKTVSVVMKNGQVHVQSSGTFRAKTFSEDVCIGSEVLLKPVMGNVQVKAGARAEIKSTVMGNVRVGSGSHLTVYGTIMGDIHARGSSLLIRGVVMGDIYADVERVDFCGVHLGQLR